MALTESQVAATELEKVKTKIPVLFNREATFYADVEKRPVEKISAISMRVPLEIRPGELSVTGIRRVATSGAVKGPTWDKALVPTVDLKHAVEWQTKAQWVTDRLA